MSDDLTIFTDQHSISGWQVIRVSRGIERFPPQMFLSMTESFPGDLDAVFINPGMPITAKIGSDLVLTGYVDVFSPGLSNKKHTISVTCRGKGADLVDCSPEWEGGQIKNCNALQIATKLATPYGISVSCLAEDAGTNVPQTNLALTSTTYAVIEENCRWAELLAYEGTDGNLILSRVGKKKAASGISEDGNIQEIAGMFSLHNRYSEYHMIRMDVDVFSDIGAGGNDVAVIEDQGVSRHRIKRIVVDNVAGMGVDGATKRGLWEAGRRRGRSGMIKAVVDSWRDQSGALWTPNTLIPVHAPSMHLANSELLVADVTYIRDMQGTRAELLLMTPEAFTPQPYLLPAFWDVQSTK